MVFQWNKNYTYFPSFFSVPPHQLLIYDNSGRDVQKTVGPLEEGADLVLTCEVRGGKSTLKLISLVHKTEHRVLLSHKRHIIKFFAALPTSHPLALRYIPRLTTLYLPSEQRLSLLNSWNCTRNWWVKGMREKKGIRLWYRLYTLSCSNDTKTPSCISVTFIIAELILLVGT